MATYQLRPFDLSVIGTALNGWKGNADAPTDEYDADLMDVREHVSTTLHANADGSGPVTFHDDDSLEEWTAKIEADPASDVDLTASEVALVREALRDWYDHCPPGRSIMGNNNVTRHMIRHALDALGADVDVNEDPEADLGVEVA